MDAINDCIADWCCLLPALLASYRLFQVRFEIAAAFLVAYIQDGMAQQHHRNTTFETDGQVVARKALDQAFDDFPLKQGDQQNHTLLHEGKERFVFDMVAIFGRYDGIKGCSLCFGISFNQPDQRLFMGHRVEQFDAGFLERLCRLPIDGQKENIIDKGKLEAVYSTYGSQGLAQRILDSLKSGGYDLDRLSNDDLIIFDELHLMGRRATIKLGQKAGLAAGMQILDIGSGLGGPARTLARTYGCHVTGVDLTQEFVTASMVLSEKVGMSDQVAFEHGDALDLPFQDEQFDGVVMLHLHMNIADKDRLFKEAHRVLRHNRKLAFWEICSGNTDTLIFPVPWANTPSFSFLCSPADLTGHIASSGFDDLYVEDATDEVITWVNVRIAATKSKKKHRRQFDYNLVLSEFRQRRANISANLFQGRIRLLRGVANKKGSG
jgi:MPBQ/MSBQ methyltransferase